MSNFGSFTTKPNKVQYDSKNLKLANENRQIAASNSKNVRNSNSMSQILSRDHFLDTSIKQELENHVQKNQKSQEKPPLKSILKSSASKNLVKSPTLPQPAKSFSPKLRAKTPEVSASTGNITRLSRNSIFPIEPETNITQVRPRSPKKAYYGNEKYINRKNEGNPITWTNAAGDNQPVDRKVTLENKSSSSNYRQYMSGSSMQSLLGWQ